MILGIALILQNQDHRFPSLLQNYHDKIIETIEFILSQQGLNDKKHQ